MSRTYYHADACLWEENTFFDGGSFLLPSQVPEASLDAYVVDFDLSTGIHHVNFPPFSLRSGVSECGSHFSASEKPSKQEGFSNLQDADPAILSLKPSSVTTTSGSASTVSFATSILGVIFPSGQTGVPAVCEPEGTNNYVQKAKFSEPAKLYNALFPNENGITSSEPQQDNNLVTAGNYQGSSNLYTEDPCTEEQKGSSAEPTGLNKCDETEGKKFLSVSTIEDGIFQTKLFNKTIIDSSKARTMLHKNHKALCIRTQHVVPQADPRSTSETSDSSLETSYGTMSTPATSALSCTFMKPLPLPKLSVSPTRCSIFMKPLNLPEVCVPLGKPTTTFDALDLGGHERKQIGWEYLYMSLDTPWLNLDVSQQQYEDLDDVREKLCYPHNTSSAQDVQESNYALAYTLHDGSLGTQSTNNLEDNHTVDGFETITPSASLQPIDPEPIRALRSFEVDLGTWNHCFDALDILHFELLLEPDSSLPLSHLDLASTSTTQILFDKGSEIMHLVSIPTFSLETIAMVRPMDYANDLEQKPAHDQAHQPFIEAHVPSRLEDLDLDAEFCQLATDLDEETNLANGKRCVDPSWSDCDWAPQETLHERYPHSLNYLTELETVKGALPDSVTDVGGLEKEVVKTDVPVHHYNILGYPVYHACRTPSALSLCILLLSSNKTPVKDPVCLKAVISSQAIKWIDPCILDADVSFPTELLEPGKANELRNFLTGLTSVRYDPEGTWQFDTYNEEQEVPQIVDEDEHAEFERAFKESNGYRGLQRPCYVDASLDDHVGFFPSAISKELRRLESPKQFVPSKLVSVLDQVTIDHWNPDELVEDEEDGEEDGDDVEGVPLAEEQDLSEAETDNEQERTPEREPVHYLNTETAQPHDSDTCMSGDPGAELVAATPGIMATIRAQRSPYAHSSEASVCAQGFAEEDSEDAAVITDYKSAGSEHLHPVTHAEAEIVSRDTKGHPDNIQSPPNPTEVIHNEGAGPNLEGKLNSTLSASRDLLSMLIKYSDSPQRVWSGERAIGSSLKSLTEEALTVNFSMTTEDPSSIEAVIHTGFKDTKAIPENEAPAPESFELNEAELSHRNTPSPLKGLSSRDYDELPGLPFSPRTPSPSTDGRSNLPGFRPLDDIDSPAESIDGEFWEIDASGNYISPIKLKEPAMLSDPLPTSAGFASRSSLQDIADHADLNDSASLSATSDLKDRQAINTTVSQINAASNEMAKKAEAGAPHPEEGQMSESEDSGRAFEHSLKSPVKLTGEPWNEDDVFAPPSPGSSEEAIIDWADKVLFPKHYHIFRDVSEDQSPEGDDRSLRLESQGFVLPFPTAQEALSEADAPSPSHPLRIARTRKACRFSKVKRNISQTHVIAHKPAAANEDAAETPTAGDPELSSSQNIRGHSRDSSLSESASSGGSNKHTRSSSLSNTMSNEEIEQELTLQEEAKRKGLSASLVFSYHRAPFSPTKNPIVVEAQALEAALAAVSWNEDPDVTAAALEDVIQATASNLIQEKTVVTASADMEQVNVVGHAEKDPDVEVVVPLSPVANVIVNVPPPVQNQLQQGTLVAAGDVLEAENAVELPVGAILAEGHVVEAENFVEYANVADIPLHPRQELYGYFSITVGHAAFAVGRWVLRTFLW